MQVDGELRPKSHRLEAAPSSPPSCPGPRPVCEPEPVSVPVVYEDEHLLVLDKPAGLVVHPGAGVREGTLVGQLLSLGAAGGPDPERPGVVHRLDRDTSGLLVAARSEAAHGALQEAIRRREVERRYLALVRGLAALADGPDRRADRPGSSRSDEALARHRRAARGRHALRSRRADGRAALLDVRLETGRTHQIRVHLAAVGLPVSGDAQYGIRGDLGLDRQFLHAHRLRFRHPLSGEQIDVESPLPPTWSARRAARWSAPRRALGRGKPRPYG